MPDEPDYIHDFKAFARGNPLLMDLPRLEQELYGANDRACAVMLGSIVETTLTVFLRGKTRPTLNSDDRRLLFDFRGPLGSFASQIIAAYAFNFFGPETRNDLDLIRLVRNEFAHSKRPFDFSEPTLRPICDRLKSADWAGVPIPSGYLRVASPDLLPDRLAAVSDRTNPKTRYVTACHVLSERLLDHSPVVGATGRTALR